MRLVQVVSDYIRRSILTTQGDMVVRGVSQPESLAAGALDTYLRGKGAGVIPAYESPHVMPSMRAGLFPDQSIPTNVWSKVNLNRTDYDTTGDFDVVNHKWVCSEAGIYVILTSIMMYTLTADDRFIVIIRINNLAAGCYMGVHSGPSGTISLAGNDMRELAVNDYIELYVWHNHGSNRPVFWGGDYTTYLAITRLA